MARKKKLLEVNVAEVVDYMRITGQFAPALRDVVERKLAGQAAKKLRLTVSKKELQKAADAFRVVHGLKRASDTHHWLKSNGITMEAFEQHVEANLLSHKFKDSLARKAKAGKYLKAPEIKESVREMVFQDWLAKALK